MLRFPVKKIRKQFKLLLLLVLLTLAVWFTYLHINQGKAIKLHFNYGKDGEKQAEGTDASRKRDPRSSAGQRKNEDAGDSREEEPAEDESNTLEEEGKDIADMKKFLTQKLTKLPWKPEYKGQANLHVFEDWCGSSVTQLRKNLHFPLYPHTRTTVKKLAVAPKWKNYGLRIFGFIHPYRDGDFQFAVASDDNSEFWLSPDENPLNARLLVFVGRLGSEWTAPGEFTKFRSQSSKSVHLMASRRYYFEILHKQDDKGSDHVEAGWRPFLPGLKYEVIDSAYISLYTDESSLKMNSVDHIPQTLASYSHPALESETHSQHGADMLKPDPRDTFYSTPMMEASRLENVLPACLYSPTYVVKDFPIARYQGLQFVYLSFVFPNDFTRLTHMEKENKCFYRESPIYLEKFGFYKYMKMDEEEDDRPFFFPNPDDFLEEEEGVDPEDESLAVDTPPARRANSSQAGRPTTRHTPGRTASPASPEREEEEGDSRAHSRRQKRPRGGSRRTRPPNHHLEDQEPPHSHKEEGGLGAGMVPGRTLSWIRTGPDELSRNPLKLSKSPLLFPQKSSFSALSSRTKQLLSNSAHPGPAPDNQPANRERKKEDDKIYITRPRLANGGRGSTPRLPREVFPGVFLYQNGKTTKLVNLSTKPRAPPQLWPPFKDGKPPLLSANMTHLSALHKASTRASLARRQQRRADDPWVQRRGSPGRGSSPAPASLRGKPHPTTTASPSPRPSQNSPRGEARVTSYLRTSEITESLQQREAGAEPEQEAGPEAEQEVELEREEGGLSEYSYEEADPRPGWAEEAINWQRTFSVNSMDFELLRSDWNDLRCNVSGNLQLAESEVVDVLAQYMEKLNERNGGIYTLLRIVNVEKRRDSARGNRYLVELELMERGKRVVRLSEYIYLLLHRSRLEDGPEVGEGGVGTASSPALTPALSTAAPAGSAHPRATTPWGTAYARPLLCQPVMLRWRHSVMVHFVVPVKNQARWVQQFISDMEHLHRETEDDNFSIIIVDFQSEDMDVEQALRESKVPRYEYLRREGNFERSAGLQLGVDTIEDSHSIVFLCDLHIHFPNNILESIRKHCVEGRLAFAPIVMRLGCGSSPREPDGYWEVNGFGLFGIYKSDFDKIGGMNTEEFKDRWGGEDWELLDRVLQNGLEVERLRLRNFFHYYHSKRGMWNAGVKKTPKG
ncbi:N-acetyl-beta-glucosaminyl-glycoprotein 4-beta-N-acetylgalactosaminyltransferase 1 [Conger conger]|uniref:N-acetyl-beta-glucosaminyl-glycoprotein 4-beta-N-acetylgalactosaminyltransferase 1 n=1 Tax=Conger conger TaxID=82655 RepID=UPI002A5A03DD|nr:N-acetyl-beta-glucosaminyl-glycoprotein 4-beta-N-acetylgalactosaminyltransferase 1 [Conger conger]